MASSIAFSVGNDLGMKDGFEHGSQNLGMPKRVWRMTSVIDSGVNKHPDIDTVKQILVFRIEERFECGL